MTLLLKRNRIPRPGHLLLARFLFLAAIAVTPFHVPAAPVPGAAKGLVIVAPSAFHAALGEFVAHKQDLLPTTLRSLEEILKQNPGVDDPEKLKRFHL